jgi:hypothetical protein
MENNPKRKKSRGLDNLQSAGSDYQETTEKLKENKVYSTENNLTVAFTLPISMIAYIKELVIEKLAEDYSYTESSAVREGIQLLKLVNPTLKQRPDEVANPTKKGRKTTLNKEIIKKTTSFLLSEADQNFMYNYIYKEQLGGGLFRKEEFFNLIIEQLEQKYQLHRK